MGDLDGDGRDDLVVGAWQSDRGGDASGAVYIEYGPLRKSLSLADADVKLAPGRAGEYVGEGPLGVADFDGDGADDLFIGAPGSFYATQPGSPGKIGETFVIYGGKRLRGAPALADASDARVTGIQMTEWLGFGVGSLGDISGDKLEDVLIGAPATAAFTGAAYLFLGRARRLAGDVAVTEANTTFVGARPGEMFGYESAGGDLDRDGAGDLFVATRLLAVQPPSVRIFYSAGGSSGVVPSLVSDADLVAPAVSAAFAGPSLDAAHDVTGDRVADLVVGLADDFLEADRTYVVAGGERPSGIISITSAATVTVAGAGHALSTGSLGRDRQADLVLGAPDAEGGGRVFVLAGPLEGQASTDDARLVLLGEPRSSAGHSVAIGDLNGDGKNDVAVGAPGNEGRVYVVFGPFGA